VEPTAALTKGFDAVTAERMPTVFVCGPLTDALEGDPEEQPALNEELGAFLDLIRETLERNGLRVVSAHRAELTGTRKLATPELPPEVIAKRDLNWMTGCAAAVIVLGTPSQPFWRTDGTFIELGLAAGLDKPVVLVADLEAYPSALVRGVPSVLASTQTLAPKRLQERPVMLLRALGQVAAQLAVPAEEPLQGEQGRAMGSVAQP
jgi:nucleoside 2-deoxyribosyltransferase